MPQEWEEGKLKKIVEVFTAVTIPVDISFEARQQILNLDHVKEILSKARIISLMDCYCRKTMGNCDKPLEVCISLNEEALTLIENLGARQISLEEALDILEMSHKAGLVHLAYYRKGEDFPIICSCCSCCCHHMSALKQFGYHAAVVKSDFIAAVDKSVCTDCGLCVERCQFGAWTCENGVVFKSELCFGCGLCVSSCPTHAVSLVKRS